MKVVIQRVKEASCKIDTNISGKCQQGYLLLVGFSENDDNDIVDKLCKKIVDLRIFEDEQQKMNLSIKDINGSILSISQFTLYADCKKGRRPSFTKAKKPSEATLLYDHFNDELRRLGMHVEEGVFGEDMKISLLNDGPVTIILDSEEM